MVHLALTALQQEENVKLVHDLELLQSELKIAENELLETTTHLKQAQQGIKNMSTFLAAIFKMDFTKPKRIVIYKLLKIILFVHYFLLIITILCLHFQFLDFLKVLSRSMKVVVWLCDVF